MERRNAMMENERQEVEAQPTAEPTPEPAAEPTAEGEPQPKAEPGGFDPDALRQMVAEVVNEALRASQKPAEEPKAEPEPTVDELKLISSADELYQIMSSPEAFNKLFGQVAQHITQRVLQGLPDLVGKLAQQQFALQQTVAQFYRDNPELEPHRDIVKAIATMVAGNHPDWDIQKVLEETAIIAKQMLNITPASPAVPNAPGGRGAIKPGEPSLADEIADLMEV